MSSFIFIPIPTGLRWSLIVKELVMVIIFALFVVDAVRIIGNGLGMATYTCPDLYFDLELEDYDLYLSTKICAQVRQYRGNKEIYNYRDNVYNEYREGERNLGYYYRINRQ